MSNEPYPKFEPMVWTDEIDAEIRSARPLMGTLFILALACIGVGLFWGRRCGFPT